MKQLKNECGSIGLTHIPSEYYDKWGHLEGRIKNFSVKVEFRNFVLEHNGGSECISDTEITLESAAPKYLHGFELFMEKPERRPDKGIEDFTTDNFNFNHIFKTRRGIPWIAKQFKENAELSNRFVDFYLRWIFRLKDINFEFNSGICCICRLNYGRPFDNYISLKNLEKVLNQLINLLDFLLQIKENNTDKYNKFPLGPFKSRDDITIDDMKKHPIWVSYYPIDDLKEEQAVEYCKDLTEKIINEFATIDILIFCEELNCYGTALYVTHTDSITSLLFWNNDEWQDIDDFKGTLKGRNTIKVKCIPSIKGKNNYEYEYNIRTYEAKPLL